MRPPAREVQGSAGIDRLRQALAVGVVVVCVAAMIVEDKRTFAWPAVTWPMYSDRPMPYPPDSYVGKLYFAADGLGGGFWVRPSDLWGADRYSVTKDMISRSLDPERPDGDAHRLAAIDLIRYKYNRTVSHVEIWELRWDVDYDASPPLIFDEPADRVLLDSFSYETLGEVPWELRP